VLQPLIPSCDVLQCGLCAVGTSMRPFSQTLRAKCTLCRPAQHPNMRSQGCAVALELGNAIESMITHVTSRGLLHICQTDACCVKSILCSACRNSARPQATVLYSCHIRPTAFCKTSFAKYITKKPTAFCKTSFAKYITKKLLN